jgi:hypothetical protein
MDISIIKRQGDGVVGNRFAASYILVGGFIMKKHVRLAPSPYEA